MEKTTKRYIVVPYIGTWIETTALPPISILVEVVPYIGTWIETHVVPISLFAVSSRTLYRYVD